MLIYNLQKQSQIEQYKNKENIHALPPIYDYWYTQHIGSRFLEVFNTGSLSISEFYASELMTVFETKKERYIFASLGSGDASLEADIYLALQKKTGSEVIFECFEISEYLIELGKINLKNQGIGEQVRLREADLNYWKSEKIYDGIIAHHSLHHIVELEQLFSEIVRALSRDGVFVSADMIGRNGHMRWPEALVIIQSIWKNIPDKYKYHRIKQGLEEQYENWDCSEEGFEGIRAQDILKLLNKNFYFKKFLAYGNLIDIFIDRNFGFNFNPNDAQDTEFIDRISLLNDLLIDFGFLKPTFMMASMTVEQIINPIIYRHWTPDFCLRESHQNPLDAANPQRKINLSYPIYQVSEALRYYEDQWLSTNFYVELNLCHPIKGISIEGFIPDNYPLPNKLLFIVNEKTYNYEILLKGSFSASLLFDKLQEDKFSLTIKAEKGWNGLIAGINQDCRNLVFLLKEIRAIS